MGGGKGGVMPIMSMTSTMGATTSEANNSVKSLTGMKKTPKQMLEGLITRTIGDEEDVEAVTGSSGTIKKVYSRKEDKR